MDTRPGALGKRPSPGAGQRPARKTRRLAGALNRDGRTGAPNRERRTGTLNRDTPTGAVNRNTPTGAVNRDAHTRESATLAAEVRDALGRAVCVLTCDGRVLVGVLAAYDPLLNIVLARGHERVFSARQPVRVVQLGSAYLVRGDNVAVLGAIDVSLDAAAHYERISAPPLPRVSH